MGNFNQLYIIRLPHPDVPTNSLDQYGCAYVGTQKEIYQFVNRLAQSDDASRYKDFIEEVRRYSIGDKTPLQDDAVYMPPLQPVKEICRKEYTLEDYKWIYKSPVTGGEYLTENARFKMNPPLRAKDDKEALIEGVLDGTIDMIATDHAPHSAEEKGRGLEKSAMGVVGLETAFPVLYTGLVKKGILTLERLTELLSVNPRKRFGIISDPGFCVWDLNTSETVDPKDFLSMGKSTPFAGDLVYGKNLMTIYGGTLVWQSK